MDGKALIEKLEAIKGHDGSNDLIFRHEVLNIIRQHYECPSAQSEDDKAVAECIYSDDAFIDAAVKYKFEHGELMNVAKAAISAMGRVQKTPDIEHIEETCSKTEVVAPIGITKGIEQVSDIPMGDEKGVISSTRQEEFGTVSEPAGLEPKCGQPPPTKAERDQSRLDAGLHMMSRTFAHWVEFNEDRGATDLSHVITPPTWPMIATLKAWIVTIERARSLIKPTDVANHSVRSDEGGGK